MDSITSNMLKQSDIQGRLRLFRYGLVVITVVTFILGILYPWVAFNGVGGLAPSEVPPITAYLPNALLMTVVVAVIMVALYFAYAEVLKRTVGKSASQSESK